MATSAELKSQIEKLQTELEIKVKEELSAAVAQIKELMKQTGVTLEHLGDGVKKVRKVSVPKAKYKDPNSEKVWSGRGHPPPWMSALLLAGKKKEDFLIKD